METPGSRDGGGTAGPLRNNSGWAGTASPQGEGWHQLWDAVRRSVAQPSGLTAPPPLRVLRVNQLESARLDEEVKDLLLEEARAVFAFREDSARGDGRNSRVPNHVSRWQSEVRLGLDALIWWCTIWKGAPSPGQALFNLHLRDARGARSKERQQEAQPPHGGRQGEASGGGGTPPTTRLQRLLLGLGTVLLPYAWSRAHSYLHNKLERLQARDPGGRDGAGDRAAVRVGRASMLMSTAERTYKVAEFVNFVVFLVGGKYPTPLQRLLRLRLMYIRPHMSRVLDYEYLNREMVWQQLADTFLLLIPAVGELARYARELGAYLGDRVPYSSRARAPRRRGGGSGSGSEGKKGGAAEEEECALCQARPLGSPFAAEPCGCRFCYLCIASHIAAEKARLFQGQRPVRCPRCARAIESLRRAPRMLPPPSAGEG